MQQHGKAARIPKHLRHPHVLKHSIAMQTIHSAGIENVRQHLGHKVISSTGEYLKVSDKQASIAIARALAL
jgi:site-specific recombinase XerD